MFNLPGGSTITLTNGALPISPATSSDQLTVTGPGAGQLTIQPSAPTGNPLLVVGAGTSTLSGMTITGGSVGAGTGSAIQTAGATTLTLDGVVLTGNTANAGGGSAGGAGAIVNVGTMTIRNSALTNNTVTNSGSGKSGGAIVNLGLLRLINTTISGNRVTGAGPNDGGAILNLSATLTAINATIANNSAANGAGGIQNPGGSTLILANTILAANSGSPAPDCVNNTGTFTSQGYNLVGNNTGCTFAAGAGDQVGNGASPINPQLGVLGNNGGTTPTMALLLGSPAINAANPAAVSDAAPLAPPSVIPCPSTDQRGVSRPQGPGCDIGALEFRTATFSGAPLVTGTPRVGQILTCTAPGTASPDGPASTTWLWLRDGAPIAGASAQTYTVAGADVGHILACRMTATNAAGDAVATSAGVAASAAAVGTPPPPPTVLTVVSSKVVSQSVVVQLGCAAAPGTSCVGDETLTTRERLRAGKVIGGQARRKGIRLRTVVVGRAHFSLVANQTLSVAVPLDATGRRLLRRVGRLPVTLQVTLTAGGKTTTVVSKGLTITTRKQKKQHTAKHASGTAAPRVRWAA